MIIRKSAVGNAKEAFVQETYSGGINIIYSDDNNKGKTIVLQSMMYALGNEPTFPAAFDYKDYYHFLEFEQDNRIYSICRYKETFYLKGEDGLQFFNSVSELKRYWTKHIFSLPMIFKDGQKRIVDPVLYLQLAFIGQDGRNTSNVYKHGYYNKDDFFEMISSMVQAQEEAVSDEEIERIKKTIAKLKSRRQLLLKEHDILKSSETAVSYFSSVNDKEAFAKRVSEMERVRLQIENLKKERNRLVTKSAKWQTTKKELRSLNNTLDQGELRCMDCNSTNISFTVSEKSTSSFDVSTIDMRNEIIASIDDKIDAYQEEIGKIEIKLKDLQEQMSNIMSEEEITLEAIVAYKREMLDAEETENEIKDIDGRLVELSEKVRNGEELTQKRKIKKSELYIELVNQIRQYYFLIDPDSNQEIAELFTKKDVCISGSEETVYYLSKLLTYSSLLDVNLPVVMDSFRAEELSTSKEDIALSLLAKMNKQVILTATLKKEEIGKYDTKTGINRIDYSDHAPCKMLTEDYVRKFEEFMQVFGMTIA